MIVTLTGRQVDPLLILSMATLYPFLDHSSIPYLAKLSYGWEDLVKHIKDVRLDMLEKLMSITTEYKDTSYRHGRDHGFYVGDFAMAYFEEEISHQRPFHILKKIDSNYFY